MAHSVFSRSPRALLIVEVLALLSWLLLAGYAVMQDTETEFVPLDVEALKTGTSRERWFGIYFQDQHVGYSVSRVGEATGGGKVYEDRSLFRIASFGKLQEVVTAGTAIVDEQGRLRMFDFFMAADPVRVAVRGEVKKDEIVMAINQAGEDQTLRFPVDNPPHVGISLESRIRSEELSVGHSFTVPYFDPVSLADGELHIKVVGVEVLENAEEAYWLETTFGDVATRSLVLPNGETLRQEGALGLAMVRMSRDAARDLPADVGDVDLISMSAAPLEGRMKGDPRSLQMLAVQVEGVPPEKVRHEPPLQTRVGNTVTVSVPQLDQLAPLAVGDSINSEWVATTLTIQANHEEIISKARAVAGDAEDRLEAVKRLNQWVFDYLEKVPTMSVPNGLEVLRIGQGDCNEHTALFVSLARALKIPTRIAAGVVYSDRIGERGAFYYHAWPEVQFDEQWLPVDPTFGQVPADATHIKLTEGDLDRQIEIMGVMGKIQFVWVDGR